jgi:RHS repeat-associated protein
VTESYDGSAILERMPAYATEGYTDGQWHYVELDLTATLQKWVPGALISNGGDLGATGVMFNGKRLFVDDMVFGSGKLRRSRAVVPGAALGGVLGSWTGPNVVAENGVAARYFHYNDLGTVLAQTKSDGTLEGAWEPDHFGNYEGRYAYAGSPTRPELGLTGKIYDEAAGAYYFGHRWDDPERGRWLSEDHYINDGNLYQLATNDTLNKVDPDGHQAVIMPPILTPPIYESMRCNEPIPQAPNPYLYGTEDSNKWAGYVLCNMGDSTCAATAIVAILHEFIVQPILQIVSETTLGVPANKGIRPGDIQEAIDACLECQNKRMQEWRKRCRTKRPGRTFTNCPLTA